MFDRRHSYGVFEFGSPQRTQGFNLLFIKKIKRKIFSVSSVSSVVKWIHNFCFLASAPSVSVC